MTELTRNEAMVIEAYKQDDFVSDNGFDNEWASTWVDGFHKIVGMGGMTFAGVMSSLSQKGVIDTNGESFSLTPKGIEIARNL